ncbi:MAG: hypothetical protein MUC60_01360 [Oscillatoria sp. Prado101]|nr:hypothetical protein [Oscillatoria sp. Prado101]
MYRRDKSPSFVERGDLSRNAIYIRACYACVKAVRVLARVVCTGAIYRVLCCSWDFCLILD